MITAKSYFSGAGGMDLGMSDAGIEVIESYEIDRAACGTLRANFSHKVNESDITQITVLDQQDADVYIGTFPCTKYSTIADIHGTRTGDDLFLHFFRHVALAQPEAYVIENVPGMRKFQVVMECLTKLPNYYVRVECPVNANMWLPQERKRLIVIGTKKPFDTLRYPEGSPVSMRDIIDVGAEVYTPDYVQKRLDGNYRDKPIITDLDGKAPTCVAHYAKDRSTRLIDDGKSVRPYSVREYARLQGFPDWFHFAGTDNDAYRQIGNAVAVPMGRWIGNELRRYFSA
ncbi:DNA (cytosine-5-)-methyltransferase [Paenibacillus sp. BIHB 4019]|uniref:DNA (cytosine-5-)-methyltransferase n=1 Tax=Paenibacillus sp. BIHB 4019 TaxID=1870819 RepID=A0A1B2DIZ0_9BACL|nr:DNA (cytosine-5-)-methyltransferase [Paenibacillus sp. BIHB 4019]ANY67682.1 DNA (cytosine-5-)-methyltransferase [Paenibacillus sp. BIHB 4019]